MMNRAPSKVVSPGPGSTSSMSLWLGAVLLTILLVTSTSARAQVCLSDPVTLTTQAQVDAFEATYGPDCVRVETTLTVSGADIQNLDGLARLERVNRLDITGNPLLTDITGLASLANLRTLFIIDNPQLASFAGLSGVAVLRDLLIEGNTLLTDLDDLAGVTSLQTLTIRDNSALANLDAFGNLASVAFKLEIRSNPELTSISGLSSLSGEMGGPLNVIGNGKLASLEGLSGLTSVGILEVLDNDALVDLSGLEGLRTQGNAGFATISDNQLLQSLDGLEILIAINSPLFVTGNPLLDDCTALGPLLDDVDDAEPGPGPGVAGIPDINGDVTFLGNKPGCNSVNEVLDAVEAEKLMLKDGFEPQEL